jgi:hypothetical protein
MKNRLRKGLLAVLLIVLGLFVPIAPVFGSPFAGGDGSAANPFQITNWHHLNNVRHHLTSHFILMNNLDSGTLGYTEWASSTANLGAGWLPIGTYAARFTGNFNGQGNEICEFFVNRPTELNVGLFGVVGTGGIIKNVGAVNVNVTGLNAVGGLVGFNWYGSVINNSYSTGSVTGSAPVGGLVGNNTGTVTNSFWGRETTGSAGGTGKTTAEMENIAIWLEHNHSRQSLHAQPRLHLEYL